MSGAVGCVHTTARLISSLLYAVRIRSFVVRSFVLSTVRSFIHSFIHSPSLSPILPPCLSDGSVHSAPPPPLSVDTKHTHTHLGRCILLSAAPHQATHSEAEPGIGLAPRPVYTRTVYAVRAPVYTPPTHRPRVTSSRYKTAADAAPSGQSPRRQRTAAVLIWD